MKTAFMEILYDDGNQETYEAIKVHVDKNEYKLFNTGDFISDYIDFMQWIREELYYKRITFCSCSSSFNHFLSDGEAYKSRHLIYNTHTKEFFITAFYNQDDERLKNGLWEYQYELFVPSLHSEWDINDLRNHKIKVNLRK